MPPSNVYNFGLLVGLVAGGDVILCAKGNSCGFCSLTNKETVYLNEKQFTTECLKKQPFSEVAKRCAKCDEVKVV